MIVALELVVAAEAVAVISICLNIVLRVPMWMSFAQMFVVLVSFAATAGVLGFENLGISRRPWAVFGIIMATGCTFTLVANPQPLAAAATIGILLPVRVALAIAYDRTLLAGTLESRSDKVAMATL